MIRIFTDGAWRRKDKAAGAGAVIIWKDGKITAYQKYLGDVTNNCAELQAVRLGLTAVINEIGTNHPICIYSDSTYAIGILTMDWKARANKELVAECLEIVKQFKNITFEWVKGHSKNRYNRLADILANVAIDQEFNIDDYYTKK